MVHVADLAAAYRLALTAGRPGESYNLATEDGVAVGRLATAIAQRFGIAQPPRVLSVADAIARFGPTADGPALDQQMSGAKARRELGWSPERPSVLNELA
jgi:nucleoside-diphosphate-sugar epimerase